MSNDQRNTIELSALEAADFEVAETKPEGVVEIAPLSSPLRGAITVPGDKSISHRAVLFSAMAEGTSRVMGVLEKHTAHPASVSAAAPAAAAPAAAPAPVPQVKLEGVSEVEAACVMAIVSHETGIPLDQLVFKSIKAV